MNYAHEEKIWKTFYKVFNDDNDRHCELAFENNCLHEKSSFALHLLNINLVDEIGVELVESQTSNYPELIPYVEEYKRIKKNMESKMDKYDKLTEILTKAVEKAKEVAETTDDGGTCNLDHCIVFLKNYNKEKTLKAITDSGLTGYKTKTWCGTPCFALSNPVFAQGFRRTEQAEAIRDFLNKNGYEASVNYIID